MICAKPRVPQITKKGLENLGEVIHYYRLKRGLTLEKFVDVVLKATGFSIGTNTLSRLERGGQTPGFDTLSLLSESGVIPFSVYELFEIASEQRYIDVSKLGKN
jgi:transcriptional regulator with XRE-family HTH domain